MVRKLNPFPLLQTIERPVDANPAKFSTSAERKTTDLDRRTTHSLAELWPGFIVAVITMMVPGRGRFQMAMQVFDNYPQPQRQAPQTVPSTDKLFRKYSHDVSQPSGQSAGLVIFITPA